MYYMSKEGIKESDNGAKGQCFYCRRYSNHSNCLTRGYKCECGKVNSYSGAFKEPSENSIFEN